MKNYADQGGCYPPGLEVEVDNMLQDLHKLLTGLPSQRHSLKLWPIFSARFYGYAWNHTFFN